MLYERDSSSVTEMERLSTLVNGIVDTLVVMGNRITTLEQRTNDICDTILCEFEVSKTTARHTKIHCGELVTLREDVEDLVSLTSSLQGKVARLA